MIVKLRRRFVYSSILGVGLLAQPAPLLQLAVKGEGEGDCLVAGNPAPGADM